MPSTIRIELDRLGFDWKSGVLLRESGVGRQSAPGRNTKSIKSEDALLDHKFSNGSNLMDIPRVFARDNKAVYFPLVTHKRGARLVRVVINPETYLKTDLPLPYPGDD